ncbi:unnamed protein product [Owenia fusiformis]|uniref:EGF-like domain-containing protein n=1 Tax=Owenia fusiformis TaxID=6347 RepID=A0A8S4Q4V9_OWEFU|nr:unnamed protein product [Owenia fusiformis]
MVLTVVTSPATDKGNPCDSNPCVENASCRRTKGKNENYTYECECENGWVVPGLQCASRESTLMTETTVPLELTTATTVAITTPPDATSAETTTSNVITKATTATSDITTAVTDVDTSATDTTTTVTDATTSDATTAVAVTTTEIGTSSTNSTPVFGTTSGAVTAPGTGVTVVIFPPLKQVKKSELEAEDGFSESDQRASAITFGITSVCIMCLVIGVIILFDIITAWHHMKRLNCIGNIRNFRNITLKEMCIECWCSKSKIFRKKRKRFRMTYVVYKYRQYQKKNGGPNVTIGSLFLMMFGIVIAKIKTFCCRTRNLDTGSKVTLIKPNTDSFDHIANDQTGEKKNSDQEIPQPEYESVEHMNELHSDAKGSEDTLEGEQYHQSDVEEIESVIVMGFNGADTDKQRSVQNEIGAEYVKGLDALKESYENVSSVCTELNDQDSDNYDLDEPPTTVENMTKDELICDDGIDIREHEDSDFESIDYFNLPRSKSYESKTIVDDEFKVTDKTETDSSVTSKFSYDGSDEDEELSILDDTVHSISHTDTSENLIKVLENDNFNTDTSSNDTKCPESKNTAECNTNEQHPTNPRKRLSPDSGVPPDSRMSTDSGVTPECIVSHDCDAPLRKAEARSFFSWSFSKADCSPKPTKQFLFPDSSQDWRMLGSSLPSRHLSPSKNMNHNGVLENPSNDISNDAITKPGAPKVVCWHEGYNAKVKPHKDWMKVIRNDLKAKSRDRSFVMSSSLQEKRQSLPSISIGDNIYNDN